MTVTTCTRTRVANTVITLSQGKERLSGVPATPIRKFAVLGNSLSIHTVHAIPSEAPMTTDYGGSVMAMLRSLLRGTRTIPNMTGRLPMFSWSAQVASSQA